MARHLLLVASLLCVAQASHACSVPVFRFALEQWQPAAYDLILYHRGPLSSSEQEAVRSIRRDTNTCNIALRMVDLDDKLSANDLAISRSLAKDTPLPFLALRYPGSNAEIANIWSGPLAADVSRLIDSPARRAIFDRLTDGDALVIVLVLSGDAAKDDAARKMLNEHLPKIAGRVGLSPKTDEGPQVQSLLPMRVRFPIVEVSRSAGEDVFVRMLLGTEDGLDKVDGPIAFPVFGRGRALCSLHGRDLDNPTELQHALNFLCRDCSCPAKELNPGIDLLIAGDWNVIFSAEAGPMPRVTSLPGIETRPVGVDDGDRAELRGGPPAGYSPIEVTGKSSDRRNWLRYGMIAAGISVVVTGIWAFRGRRTPPTS
jgi:hypothetical protein